MIQEIPNSHYWTDLEMMINYFKEVPELDRNYIIVGLQNMQTRGYSIKKSNKKYTCTDCSIGEEKPCVYKCLNPDDVAPVSCPLGTHGEDAKWKRL